MSSGKMSATIPDASVNSEVGGVRSAGGFLL